VAKKGSKMNHVDFVLWVAFWVWSSMRVHVELGKEASAVVSWLFWVIAGLGGWLLW